LFGAFIKRTKTVNKLLIAAFLLVAAFPTRGQTPPPSPPGAETSGTQPASPSSSSTPATKVDSTKEQLIRQVLVRSKEAEQAQQRIFQALAGMKLMMPRVEEKFWDKYRQLISLDELRDRLVYVYDKHYTSDELNDLLKFYDSPVGKKVSDNAVPILRESMDIAQDLSKRAGQSVSADLQAEQFLKSPRAAGSLGAPVPSMNSASSPAPNATATATP
jgi:hypothetical protein